MKLILTQQPDIPEPTVEIVYAELDDRLKKLIVSLKKSGESIFCIRTDNESKHRVLISDIYYIEVMERKTFVYTGSEVFRSKMKFTELLDMLRPYGFVQVNRNCIINVDVLDDINMTTHRKADAILENGEKVIVSRAFMHDIITAFGVRTEGIR